MVMDRDGILQSEDRQFEVVDVPEWGPGAQVRVSSLSGSERDTFEQSITVRRGMEVSVNLVNARAKLCVLTMVDDNGDRLFADEDVFELGKKNATALNRVFEVAQRLSGLTEDDVKEAVSAFAPDPSEGSSSA